MTDWGRLPDSVYNLIKSHEWDHPSNLQKRLKGERSFPIVLNLRPPSDKQAIADVEHFREYVSQWRRYPLQKYLVWENRHYRSLKLQRVPSRLVLSSMQQLLEYLGEPAIVRSQHWQQLMQPLLALEPLFYPVLIKHLATLETLTRTHIKQLVLLLPQLKRNMGRSRYLRALPLVGIDSKFVEIQIPLISGLLDVLHNGEVTKAGGLKAWLACEDNPGGWIVVRPLCNATRERIGGFAILQLPTNGLREKELPAQNIIVVENLQSGLGLPQLNETIAVIGGGANVAWMNAAWLQHKNIAYWGDIDTWGLNILSDARTLAPTVTPLMMNEDVLTRFEEFRVEDPALPPRDPLNLTQIEQRLYARLKDDHAGTGRLEQERLPADFVESQCHTWLMSCH